MEMVVMENEPDSMVGIPLNMYWMLRLVFLLREAVRSIFTSRKGSSVARIWKLSVALVVAGVMMLSVMSNQPLSAARRI